MKMTLSDVEARVIGVLIEKQITTPDYYPMTLNALVAGCNQKSNRNPMMAVTEQEVKKALEMRYRGLVYHVTTTGSRVPKYEHGVLRIYEFSPQELGVVCELLLRGPQTLGELRTHCARLCKFESLEQVDDTLRELADWDDGPFVAKLPREPGRRECRYAHLFSGPVEVTGMPVPLDDEPRLQADSAEKKDRRNELEEKVASLRADMDELKQAFEAFKKQFE